MRTFTTAKIVSSKKPRFEGFFIIKPSHPHGLKKKQIWVEKPRNGSPGREMCWANATALAEAGQFSRGKERTKESNYYESIALFTLFDKRLSKVRHVNPDVKLSEKHGIFLSIFQCVCTSMGTKKGRIYGKGAPFKGRHRALWGAVVPNFPPCIRHWGVY